jgi:hypothetical protein
VTNVRYCDLMADPAALILAVEDRLGLPGAGDSRMLITDFLERQRSGVRAAPPADYGSFGATPDAVRRDRAMARYIETFDIPEERERVTAPLAGA